MSDEKQKSIGALWENQSSKGKYFTGQLEINEEKIKIVVFANDYKKEDKHPDWKIFISKPREQSSQNTETPPVVRKGQYEDAPQEEDSDGEQLPF